jgi:monovalent cation:H+ antiporter-2, CPA2 family
LTPVSAVRDSTPSSPQRRPRKADNAVVRGAAAALVIGLGFLSPHATRTSRAAIAATNVGDMSFVTEDVGDARRSHRGRTSAVVSAVKSNQGRRQGRGRVQPLAPKSPVDRAVGVALSVKEKIFPPSADDGHGGHSAAVNDALVLLGTTVVIVPLMRTLKTSPILGFLAAGIALGPNGFALVRDVGTSKALAELGVVFFLFEMGLELSTSKLKSLGADVFGLGTAQFLVTGLLIGGVSMLAGLPVQTAIVVGAGLALSSSAFVLQLLGERGEVGTRYGRAAFGVLLFQDLAVVPVLVLTPLLAGSGGASAVMSAVLFASAKAAVALAFIVLMGKTVLQPVFRFVAKAQSQEAFIAVILFTALGTSALTAGLGLSDTLGAFLAGVMLAETTFRHQVEADIKPFRGLLLGLFFITVGFSIDLQLAFTNIGTVASLVFGLLGIKAGVIAAAGALFGLSAGTALRTGLLLSQGGEFAFVIFGLACQVGVLPAQLSQLLLLVVALSMGLTPTLAGLGSKIASRLERQRGLIGVRKEDADTADARDFVMVAGFGRVGQSVCEMLDSKLVRYLAFDQSPSRVIEARGKGLPVFFGDATRPEVLKAAGVARARAVVVTLDDEAAALRAVQNIRREFGPDLEIFCRARDKKHQMLLKAAGATAIVPELLEASLLLGGAVLMAYGTPADEVNALIQDSRRSNVGDIGTNSRSLNDIMTSSFIDKKIFPNANIAAVVSETSSELSEASASAPASSVAIAEELPSAENAARASVSEHDAMLSATEAALVATAAAPESAATSELQGGTPDTLESLESLETVSRDDDIYETAAEVEDWDADSDAKDGQEMSGGSGGNSSTGSYLSSL